MAWSKILDLWGLGGGVVITALFLRGPEDSGNNVQALLPGLAKTKCSLNGVPEHLLEQTGSSLTKGCLSPPWIPGPPGTIHGSGLAVGATGGLMV